MSAHKVVGMRRFNDVVEGTKYDFTKIRVLFKAAGKNAETELGYGQIELQIGDSTHFDKLKAHNFPLDMELEIEHTTKGMEVVGYKVLAPIGKAA